MKKHLLLWLSAVMVIALAIFQRQVGEVIVPEKPVSKNISFAVYAANDYSSPVYKDASAKLRITVTKVKGCSRTIVWDKTYDAKQLHDYPSFQHAMSQKVVINNVLDSREKLEVVYTLTYDNKGSVMQMYNGTVVSKGEQTGQLLINI